MRTAKLPVLPHQEIALRQAGGRLDQFDARTGQDLRSALEWQSELATGAGEARGRAALMQAVEVEDKVRQNPGLADRVLRRAMEGSREGVPGHSG